MNISISKGIKPLSEFQKKADEFIEQLNNKKEPIILTQNGESAAVLLDVTEYERLLKKVELLEEILNNKTYIKKEGKNYTLEEAEKIIRKNEFNLLEELKIALKLLDSNISEWAADLKNPEGKSIGRTNVYQAVKYGSPEWLLEEIKKVIARSHYRFQAYYEKREQKEWYTTNEVAKIKGLEPKTISNYASRGDFKKVRRNDKGFWEIHKSEL